MRKRWVLLSCAIVLLFLIVVTAWPSAPDRGQTRYFANDAYQFETLRAGTDTAPVGGDANEITLAIANVTTGDAESWRAGWQAQADRVLALAGHTNDPLEKGNALLRAHTYYRTAEFFLSPDDARRPALWKANVAAFDAGLAALGVAHERLAIPFDGHHLNAIYYPGPAGAEAKPLLVVVGGYDSTMEELYFSVASAARAHGYAVLTYEGPGQGAVLRAQGLTLRPDWEKPNGAVLDAFLASHTKPHGIVLLGESLGGYLAPRAAAYDSRIDGVVAYDVFYDAYAVATRHVPAFAFWLRSHGYDGLLRKLAALNTEPGAVWAVSNGEWVLGVHDAFAVLDAFKPYRLAPVAARIKADVLILGGQDDHFVPPEQLGAFRDSLTNARSVTAIMFDTASGGGGHCQIGAPSLWQAALFDWLAAKFPAVRQ